MKTIVCSPDPEALDTIEKMVKDTTCSLPFTTTAGDNDILRLWRDENGFAARFGEWAFALTLGTRCA